MKLNFYTVSNTKFIFLSGSFESLKEQREFLYLVTKRDYLYLKIYFFDLKTIPVTILKSINDLKSKIEIKIYIYSFALFKYLRALNMPVYLSYKNEKKLKKEIDLNQYEIGDFLKSIYFKYGLDFRGYRLDSITRRLNESFSQSKFTDFRIYKKAVLDDIFLFENLFLNFSISVSSFFRDESVFKFVKEYLFSYLESFSHIKIWSAGSSSAKEAVSIAIILDELGLLDRATIYATDFNPYILEYSKNLIYPINELNDAKLAYQKAGLSFDFDKYIDIHGDFFEIKNYIRESIVFSRHSLTQDGVFNEFHLILCRNVLIYFSYELQLKVLKLLSDSINRQGFLVLGESENILNRFFENFNLDLKIFKKI